MDTQDGHDRIDEMLYISLERKWIEGANNRAKWDTQPANESLSSTSYHPNHPVYPCELPLFGKLGTRELGLLLQDTGQSGTRTSFCIERNSRGGSMWRP